VTRTRKETATSRKLVEWTNIWNVVGLSRATMTPGVTTPDDVY
jgi:hypothetical protein